MTRSKWFLPLFALALGVIIFGAQWIGGNARGGLASFAVLAVFGLVILLGGRSETVRGLRGDARDERFRQIDIQAMALSGLALITAIIVAFVVQLARGEDVTPYSWLAAIGGVAYVAAILFMRFRS